MPVVAEALSPDRQEVIKIWKTKMIPCTRGRVNNTDYGVERHGVNDLRGSHLWSNQSKWPDHVYAH